MTHDELQESCLVEAVGLIQLQVFNPVIRGFPLHCRLMLAQIGRLHQSDDSVVLGSFYEFTRGPVPVELIGLIELQCIALSLIGLHRLVFGVKCLEMTFVVT